MKKYLYLVFALVAMPLAFAGCNESFPGNDCVSRSNQFQNDFSELCKKQELLLATFEKKQRIIRDSKNIKKTASLEKTQVVTLVNEMDSLLQVFYTQNYDYLKTFSPKVQLSQDEIDLIMIDKELFLKFIKDNFSQSLFDITNEYYQAEQKSEVRPALSALNPLEQSMVNNMVVVSKIDRYLDKVVEGTPMMHSNNELNLELKYCKEDYDDALSDCWVRACRSLGGSAIAALIFAPESLGASVGIAATTSVIVYIDCHNAARRDYNKCVNRANERYGH